MQPSREGGKDDIIGEVERLGKKMLSLASKGDWDEVHFILTWEVSPTVRVISLQPIDSSDDTLLHMAASEGQTKVVEYLLRLMEQENEMGLICNVTGNTPLHLAAANGHDETCRLIMEVVPEWGQMVNEDGETPIFLAALTGAKEVFSTLISMSRNKKIALRRRNDGDTILHCAVFGEYFGASRSPSAGATEEGLMMSGSSPTITMGASKFRSVGATEEAELMVSGSLPTTTMTSQSPRKQGGRGIANSFKRLFRNLLVAFHVILAFFGFATRITQLRKMKEKHVWASEVMNLCLQHIRKWSYMGEIHTGRNPYAHRRKTSDINLDTVSQPGSPPQAVPASSSISQTDSDTPPSIIDASSYQLKEDTSNVSPFLIAGINGVKEMVEAIMKAFPEAIQDRNLKNRNIILLAAEHRQPEIYEIFLKWKTESWLGKADVDGNTVLHLAAKHTQDQSLLIPGAALQMQRDIAWFKVVKENLPPSFPKRQNHKGQTAMEVFTETHQELAKKWAKWLNNAAQSCSVVAALIIGVAFATVAAVPGGLVEDHGFPVLHGKLAFNVFSVSSLLALCFSALALIMFLGILTSPYQDSDFGNELTRKLIYGLASLFISIAAMFLSFFSGDLFVLDRKIKYMAYPLFIITSCGALAGFPLYYEITRQMITDFPIRSYPNKLAF